MKKNIFIPFLFIALLLLGGCSSRIVDFTIISTKNVDLSNAANFERGKNRVSGEDVAHIVISIPFGSPTIKEAIDRALESVPGTVALLDGVVYSKGWYVFFYGQSKFLVEGTPLIDPSMASTYEPGERYYSVSVDRKGNAVKEVISKEAYEYEKVKMLKEEVDPRTFKSSMGF